MKACWFKDDATKAYRQGIIQGWHSVTHYGADQGDYIIAVIEDVETHRCVTCPTWGISFAEERPEYQA